jgi:hypothetical protein
MLTVLTILCILGYLAAAAWTFGYVRGALNVAHGGWDNPVPLFASICWPITLLVSMIILPVQRAGFAFQQHKLEKKKQRIAIQEKVRVELQEAEKELEVQFEQLAEEEAEIEQQEIAKKKKVEKAARVVDSFFFDKTTKKTSSRKRSA